MIVDKETFAEMTLENDWRQKTIDKMIVDKMTVDKMTVDKMTK